MHNVRTVSCFGIWTRTDNSWSVSRKWPITAEEKKHDSFQKTHKLKSLIKTLCAQPFFSPKKRSSSWSSSWMESRRILMVSKSTRGSRILERNLLAPPAVLVWLSMPKRLCSLLCGVTDKHWGEHAMEHAVMLWQTLPVVSVIDHQLQVQGRRRVDHGRLLTAFKDHSERLSSIDGVLNELEIFQQSSSCCQAIIPNQNTKLGN